MAKKCGRKSRGHNQVHQPDRIARFRKAVGRVACAFSLITLIGCSKAPSTSKDGLKQPPRAGTSTQAVSGEPRSSLVTAIKGGAQRISVTPDGKRVAVLGYGKQDNVQVWDVNEQKKVKQFSLETGGPKPVALSPTGELVAFAGALSGITLAEVSSGKELRNLAGTASALRFSPKGDVLVAAVGESLRGFDPQSGKILFDAADAGDGVSELSIFFDGGKRIASTGEGNAVYIWEMPSGKLARKLDVGSEVSSLAVSPDGSRLAFADVIGPIHVWDLSAGKSIKDVDRAGGSDAFLFLPDNRTLAYTARDGDNARIVLAHLESGKKQELTGHDRHIEALDFAPDANILLSGGSVDKTVKVWDLSN